MTQIAATLLNTIMLLDYSKCSFIQVKISGYVDRRNHLERIHIVLSLHKIVLKISTKNLYARCNTCKTT